MFLFCLVFAMSLCASVYMCFVVNCWERADLLALVCGVCCEFVTFPLVSWYQNIKILKLELKTSKNESHKIQINHYGKQNSNSSMYSSFYEMNFIKVTVRSIIHKIRKKSTFNFYLLHL